MEVGTDVNGRWVGSLSTNRPIRPSVAAQKPRRERNEHVARVPGAVLGTGKAKKPRREKSVGEWANRNETTPAQCVQRSPDNDTALLTHYGTLELAERPSMMRKFLRFKTQAETEVLQTTLSSTKVSLLA